MKNRNLLIFLILAISFFTGCDKAPQPCKPKIVVKKEFVYIKSSVPTPNLPPKMLEYKMNFLKLNENDYYIMTLHDGDIMLSNWKRYKSWSVTNYKILQKLNK